MEESTMTDSQRLLEAICRISSQIILLLDTKGIVKQVWIRDLMRAKFPHLEQYMTGRSMAEFMCESDKLPGGLAQILGGAELHDEPLCGQIGGRTMRFLVSAKTVLLDGAEHILCLAIDDSRQQQTEERLQQSRRNIRTITSCSPDGICILRGELIFYANDTFYSMFGYHAVQAPVSIRDYFDPEGFALLCDMREQMGRKPTEEKPLRAYSSDGSALELLVVCAPLVMESESYLYLHFRNETETRRLWTHVQRTEEVSATAGIISSLSAELLELMRDIQKGLATGQSENVEGRVASSIHLLERLQVLGNSAKEPLEVHDPGVLVREVLEIEKQILVTAGIEVKVREEKPVFVRAGRIHLQQIFINLVQNAVQAMNASSVKTLEISIDATASRGRIVFVDTGHGIKPEQKDQIFVPLFSTATDGKPATGMGLPLARILAGKYGGSVDCRPGAHGGAEFIVELPLFREASIGVEPCELRVLVVDDDRAIRDLLGAVIRSTGVARIEYAVNGRQALDMIAVNQYNLVFLDVSMPKSSGLDVIRELKRRQDLTPVVLVTGQYSVNEIKELAAAEKLFGYVMKPFNIREIQELLEPLLRKNR